MKQTYMAKGSQVHCHNDNVIEFKWRRQFWLSLVKRIILKFNNHECEFIVACDTTRWQHSSATTFITTIFPNRFMQTFAVIHIYMIIKTENVI